MGHRFPARAPTTGRSSWRPRSTGLPPTTWASATTRPADVTQLHEYNRTGRNALGYEGPSRSGMTALFDNFMNGTNTVTSEHGWKWNDVIYDLGLRFADIAKQDYVVLARLDILYGFGVRQIGIAYSQANQLGSGLAETVDAGLTHFGRSPVARALQTVLGPGNVPLAYEVTTHRTDVIRIRITR